MYSRLRGDDHRMLNYYRSSFDQIKYLFPCLPMPFWDSRGPITGNAKLLFAYEVIVIAHVFFSTQFERILVHHHCDLRTLRHENALMNRCTNFSEVTLFYFIIFHCFLFPSFAFVYHLIRIRYPRGEQVAQVSPSPFSHSLLLERTDSITKFNLPAGFVRISTRVEDLRFSEWPFTTFSQGNQLPDQAAHQMIINEAHGSVKVMYTQLTKP